MRRSGLMNVDVYKWKSIFLKLSSSEAFLQWSREVQRSATLGRFCRLFEYETGQVLC